MSSLVLFLIIAVVLTVPVKLAATFLGAERDTWKASMGCLFFGAFLVNLVGSSMSSSTALFVATFVVFFLCTWLILWLQPFKAAILALLMTVVYAVPAQPGRVGVGINQQADA
ncbi:hypothetical protein IGB42_01896 [Andreprevotia sp. IGB-42]|uniref:hypothetical protein n=1 Tax=Andreprevotia sp. IGB-42 TaxID=2497473 RepID=UPI00135B9C8E|nr:hypothetical protein [Andreprevotia sp. IGB-42]KAF0813545.1 hypothetical protein IGB42_01896 [Andreprevotia sp. IGB-42]